MPPSISSSYDTGRNGYAAFFELLRREGISRSRFERPHGLLNRSLPTLLIAAPTQRLMQSDTRAVKDWLAHGGTLIVLGNNCAADVPGIGLPKTITTSRFTGRARVLGHLRVTRYVNYIRGSGKAIFSLHHQAAVMPLAVAPAGIIAVQYSVGKGSVIALSDPTVFSNGQLSHEDNARFAYNVGSLYAPIAFDETVQGYERGQNAWEVLPAPVHVAIVLAAGAALLVLIGGNFRFGPLQTLPDKAPRDSSAFINSMANIMARGHARQKALRELTDATLRNVRLDRSDTRRAAVQKFQRLGQQRSLTDNDLLAAAVCCAQLRKEYGEYGSLGSANRAANTERRT